MAWVERACVGQHGAYVHARMLAIHAAPVYTNNASYTHVAAKSVPYRRSTMSFKACQATHPLVVRQPAGVTSFRVSVKPAVGTGAGGGGGGGE